MRIIVRCLLVLAVALISADASAAKPTSFMLVPSGKTIPELERLSRKAGTTVDVFTVSREERRLILNGSGGDAFTGHDVDANPDATEQVVRIPFDDLALVYSREDGSPYKEQYPVLPKVGAAEQRLTCEEMAVDLRRTEAIRWFARERGGTPFTEREAAVMRTEKILSIGVVVLSAAAGAPGLGLPVAPATENDAYRYAVTAADRRELALLELKRDRQCGPRETGTEAGTDVAILEPIDVSQQELAAKNITDREQMERQTRLLDQLYPAPPHPVAIVATAAAREKVASDLSSYEVSWYANTDLTALLGPKGKELRAQHPMKTLMHALVGHLTVTDEAFSFIGKPIMFGGGEQEVSVPFADLTDAVVFRFVRASGVVITHRDGHKDSFQMSQNHAWFVDDDAMRAMAEMLKSKIPGASGATITDVGGQESPKP